MIPLANINNNNVQIIGHNNDVDLMPTFSSLEMLELL